MRPLLLKLGIFATAIAATAALLPGIDLDGGAASLLWVTALFLAVNLLLKPLVQLISLPLIVISLGLFGLVINGALLLFTSWLADDLEIDGLGTAGLGALFISAVVVVAETVLDRAEHVAARG